ncbi:alpha/beta hydrolase [Roseomonas sp. CCTCC AB2023176]|uniref:alpha/beta hydrolase n=1 Tax=Roseomonas sp. CCTCC AB2023176 TaxID=3342640 RepID=UPI0035DA1B30
MSGAVFLHHDQDSLDRAYDQRVWARDMDAVMARLAARGEEARARLGPQTRRYGPGADEVLDVFAAGPGAPVHVHVHGGAWRALGRGDASFLAPAFVKAGVTLVVPDFTNLPLGRMPGMAAQVAAAVAWTAQHAAEFGGDPDRLTLSGHSSGAHLAAVVATGAGGPGRFRQARSGRCCWSAAPMTSSRCC